MCNAFMSAINEMPPVFGICIKSIFVELFGANEKWKGDVLVGNPASAYSDVKCIKFMTEYPHIMKMAKRALEKETFKDAAASLVISTDVLILPMTLQMGTR